MVTEVELLAAVDAAFQFSAYASTGWPDPHPNRAPLQEEYSRLSDPGKWRIIGARADAWLVALVDTGLATLERDIPIRWRVPPMTAPSRTDRLVPAAAGALPLVVARCRFGGIDDAGFTLGVGDPAVCVSRFPACGCDACNGGSQEELDRLDGLVCGVVSGAFRRLSRRDSEITVNGARGWSASGMFDHHDIQRILAHPAGWDELVGVSWLCQR